MDLEPTPGFAIAAGAPTLRQQTIATAAGAADFLIARRLPLLGMLASFVLVGVMRRQLANTIELLWLRLRLPSLDHHQAVLLTLRLLERRAARAGQARPADMTPSRWLATNKQTPLATLVNWALYAPAAAPPPRDVFDTCRRVLGQTTQQEDDVSLSTTPALGAGGT